VAKPDAPSRMALDMILRHGRGLHSILIENDDDNSTLTLDELETLTIFTGALISRHTASVQSVGICGDRLLERVVLFHHLEQCAALTSVNAFRLGGGYPADALLAN